MRFIRGTALVCGMFAILGIPAFAGPFVVFPQAGQFASPDGRYIVRSMEDQGAASEFRGTFRALWLTESLTGRSRKLCDYVGEAAVAWSKNNFLVITLYVSRKTSRAMIVSAENPERAQIIDVPALIRMVPPDMRAPLRENDHVFVEASLPEENILHLRVWGYGRHDPNGFRWACQYQVDASTITCGTRPAP
jgi:hypothetical protein